MKRFLLGLILAAGLAFAGATNAAPIDSFDFQGDSTGGFGAGTNELEPGFDAFAVGTLGDTTTPTPFAVTGSGGATLTLTSGTTAAWKGDSAAASTANPLQSDYLVILEHAGLGINGSLGFELSGLTANSLYDIAIIAANNQIGDARTVEATVGASSVTASNAATLAGSTAVLTVSSDAAGKITGTLANAAGSPEAGLAGLTVTLVPEPASLALFGLGGLLMLHHRRTA